MIQPPSVGPKMDAKPNTLANNPWILGALGRRENVADDGEQQSHRHARAQSLHAAKHDELRHAVAGNPMNWPARAAKGRCGHEQNVPARKNHFRP